MTLMVRIMLLLLVVLAISSCANGQLDNNNPEIKFRHVGSYQMNGVHEEYVYVYGNIYQDSMSERMMDFFTSIKSDTVKEYIISFLHYHDELPDTAGYEKNNDLLDGKFTKDIFFEIYYSRRNRKLEYIYFYNGDIQKIEKKEWVE